VATVARENVDIAIVGGGLVGSSLACALADSGFSLALLESAETAQAPTGFDQRKLALAQGSLQTLTALSVLPKLSSPPTAIRAIHISRVGDFGRVLLQAADFGHQAFGGVVLAQDLGFALVQQVQQCASVRRFCPAQVTAYTADDQGACLRVQAPTGAFELHAKLVVAADGSASFLRHAAGIGVHTHDYQQTLLVCSLQTERAADGMAYERFSASGPLALLPMAGGRYGSICAVHRHEAEAVAALSDCDYVAYLQSRFGWRAGKFLNVSSRTSYPLIRIVAERLHAGPLVLVGNAAQTIHPIGAQGFNLGLRDAMALATNLRELGLDAETGTRHAESRVEDRNRTLAMSDGLARITANPDLPMHILRSLALSALAAAPTMASALVGQAMGRQRYSSGMTA
jgi:2-octaprenyl-6-methoxyphenol hydroxylase